ncbi:MAG: DMT family transporter, partial [Bdellovibrionales bacterium]|nr:DMT family transporter [Bdellovibrionales bacterium]
IPLLGEKPGGIQWIFFIGAIVGVSIVKGFDSSAPWTHYLPAFGSAMIAGLAHNLVRMLRKTDHPQIIIFYLAWVSFVISLPLSIGTWVWPNAREYILVLSLGIFMQLGQFYMTKAYATAPMASILHFNYVSTVLATIVGYFFFFFFLPLPVLGGIALIIVSVYCANRFAKLMIVRP